MAVQGKNTLEVRTNRSSNSTGMVSSRRTWTSRLGPQMRSAQAYLEYGRIILLIHLRHAQRSAKVPWHYLEAEGGLFCIPFLALGGTDIVPVLAEARRQDREPRQDESSGLLPFKRLR